MTKNNIFTKKQRAYLPFKRFLDIFNSFFGIIFCFAFIWWWVFIINLFATKGHPFYCPLRVGKNKKEFRMLKFRSLKYGSPEVPPSELKLEEQAKMYTGFGNFLRKSSLDETPQLFNIFVGQMSFIGPRPGAVKNEELLIKEREKYNPNAYDVRPGLSGYAQVKMNRQHDPSDKAYYDHFYVKNISFKLDFKTFGFTIIRLFGLMKGR